MVQTIDISNLDYLIQKNALYEISKVYTRHWVSEIQDLKTQILWDLLKCFQMNTCVITKMLSIPIPKSRNGITVCAAE